MTTRQLSRSTLVRKFGTAAFLFFLAKGLLWLATAGILLVSAV